MLCQSLSESRGRFKVTKPIFSNTAKRDCKSVRVQGDGKREKVEASLLSIIPRVLSFQLFSARDTNSPPRRRNTSSVSSLCLNQRVPICVPIL